MATLVPRASRRSRLRSCLTGRSSGDHCLECPSCGWTDDRPGSWTLPELAAHECATAVRRRRRPLAVLLVLGALVLAGVAAAAVTGLRDAEPAPAPVADSGPPRALILSGASLSYLDAQHLAHQLGWQPSIYALPGAGFSRSTLGSGSSLALVARRLLAPGTTSGAPDVVLLQGGEADHVSSGAPLRQTTADLLDFVRKSTGPGTQVVLVGPIPAETVPRSLVAVNDLLAEVAQAQGVPYLDAVALGWRVKDPTLPGAMAAALRDVLPPD